MTQSPPLAARIAEPWFLARALALALAIFAVYANGLNNEFTLDDDMVIVKNPLVQETARLGQIWTRQNWMLDRTISVYRPLTMTTFALNRMLDPGPFGFRLGNLFLHLLCSSALLLLCLQLTGARVASFWAALLFAVHPIHTEAVTSIVGRAELLSTLFSLLCVSLGLESLRLREVDPTRPRRARRWMLASAGCFLLGLLSKESAAPTLALLALATLRDRDVSRWKQKFFLLLPAFGALAFYFALRYLALGGWLLAPGTHKIDKLDNLLRFLPFPDRLYTAFAVFGKALGLLLYPVSLSADYSFNAIPAVGSLLDLRGLAPMLFLLGLLLYARAAWRQSPPLFWAGALLLIPYALNSNWVLPTWTIFGERLLYLPSAGFCLAAGLGLERFGHWTAPSFARSLALLACLGLGARTIQRNSDWKDNLTLYASSLRAAPDSAKLLHNLSNQLRLRGQAAQALPLILRAIRVYPDFQEFYVKLGLTYQDLGQYDKSLEAFREAARREPRDRRIPLLLEALQKERGAAP